MNLLDKCITVLFDTSEKCEILDINSGAIVLDLFFDLLPFTTWGPIDWAIVKDKFSINSLAEIPEILGRKNKSLNEPIYIIWDEASLPVIKTSLKSVIDNVDDVTAVSFDTWLFCPTGGWVIEFYHEGKITLGFDEHK